MLPALACLPVARQVRQCTAAWRGAAGAGPRAARRTHGRTVRLDRRRKLDIFTGTRAPQRFRSRRSRVAGPAGAVRRASRPSSMEGQPRRFAMEKQAAMHIVSILAQGIDPQTGESFPAGSPYQHPDTVRALFQAVEAMAGASPGRSRQASSGAPENAGKPWPDDENHALGAAFDAGKAIARTRAEPPAQPCSHPGAPGPAGPDRAAPGHAALPHRGAGPASGLACHPPSRGGGHASPPRPHGVSHACKN
jgi:hypothetical protein